MNLSNIIVCCILNLSCTFLINASTKSGYDFTSIVPAGSEQKTKTSKKTLLEGFNSPFCVNLKKLLSSHTSLTQKTIDCINALFDQGKKFKAETDDFTLFLNHIKHFQITEECRSLDTLRTKVLDITLGAYEDDKTLLELDKKNEVWLKAVRTLPIYKTKICKQWFEHYMRLRNCSMEFRVHTPPALLNKILFHFWSYNVKKTHDLIETSC